MFAFTSAEVSDLIPTQVLAFDSAVICGLTSAEQLAFSLGGCGFSSGIFACSCELLGFSSEVFAFDPAVSAFASGTPGFSFGSGFCGFSSGVFAVSSRG